ncbi:hypothetical protein, partial [Planococcus sp. 4-30]|uniref:hypothetical protein n=1 Tax=Planococcus sp. 4-30 TaxID=2874583 RepID=UPI001CBC96F3
WPDRLGIMHRYTFLSDFVYSLKRHAAAFVLQRNRQHDHSSKRKEGTAIGFPTIAVPSFFISFHC